MSPYVTNPSQKWSFQRFEPSVFRSSMVITSPTLPHTPRSSEDPAPTMEQRLDTAEKDKEAALEKVSAQQTTMSTQETLIEDLRRERDTLAEQIKLSQPKLPETPAASAPPGLHHAFPPPPFGFQQYPTHANSPFAQSGLTFDPRLTSFGSGPTQYWFGCLTPNWSTHMSKMAWSIALSQGTCSHSSTRLTHQKVSHPC